VIYYFYFSVLFRSAACLGYLVFGEVPRPAILVGAAVLLFGVAIGTKQGRCRVLQILGLGDRA
jgi:drug/metabolite transporter (DMT)-like permease